MKDLKKILPVAAFAFAIIGSFAMSSPNYSDLVWKYNGGSETSPNRIRPYSISGSFIMRYI